jgi:O-antigen chain-terminating methyltransferase
MKDDFYTQFEQAFRGERPEIKARLQVYAPFIEPLIDLYPDAIALDLGCGRGEWLEVLRDKGLAAQGVDLDDGMLTECRKLNLNASLQDAIAALNSFENESISMVSAFHLVEHISFETLRSLISEAFRVLKPGGLLVLETPNPENILVGTSNFYLDPTHTRPIPPGLLKFMSKYYGFINGTVLGLQESPTLRENASPSLRDVLGGASPDYALVAQKSAPEEIIARFKAAFSLEHGLTTDTLMNRFDQHRQQGHAELSQAIAVLGTQSQQQHAELTQAVSALNAQIHAVYSSSSWRVTRPLRALGSALRHAKEWLKLKR